MKRSKQILVKAITRAEYESLPAVVRYFSPPFDVLALDHYEAQPERSQPRHTADELIKYFDGVSLRGESKSKATGSPTTKKKRHSRPNTQPAANQTSEGARTHAGGVCGGGGVRGVRHGWVVPLVVWLIGD